MKYNIMYTLNKQNKNKEYVNAVDFQYIDKK